MRTRTWRWMLIAVVCGSWVAGANLALGAQGTPASTPEGTPGAGEGYAHPEWLVDAAWVEEHRRDPNVRIVALTPVDEFEQGHIPGAAQIDWPDLELTDTSEAAVERWRGEVEAMLTALGVTPEQTVVAYDGGTLWAARVWWVLDYLGHADKRILNGGLPAWTAAGGEAETGPSRTAPTATPYRGTSNDGVLATLDEVAASLEDPTVVRIDARTAEEYAEGHIPGAVNVNFPQNAAPEPPKVWKSAEELRALYATVGATPDKRIIPYCTTGVRSAVTSFTLRLIGYERVELFTGSWAEWSAHPELPRVTGPQPGATPVTTTR